MRLIVFDSGIGGLSAISPYLKKGSQYDELIYIADLANLPYGSKSPSVVLALIQKLFAKFFQENNVRENDEILLACNTASTQIVELKNCFPKIKITSVLDLSCQAALAKLEEQKRIVVLATTTTVKSNAYPMQLKKLGYGGQLLQIACPLFVPLVEEGFIENKICELSIKHYLDEKIQDQDLVILGCTHYPYLKKMLNRLYPTVDFVEASDSLELKEPRKSHSLSFLLSDDNESTKKIEQALLRLDIKKQSFKSKLI